MKEKGQALVEFILILPVILLIFMALIDVGNIFIQKLSLNDAMQTVTDLYQNDEKKELLAYVANEELVYDEKTNNDMVTLILQKNIEISAPGLSNVLGKNYTIEETKTIYVGDKSEQ